MQHTCPKSGLQWHSPFLSLTSPTPVEHPVFSLSYPQLCKALESTFLDNRLDYSAQEHRASVYLLLLAALAKLPVQWKATVSCERAFPKLLTHQKSLLRALHHSQAFPHSKLPGYKIAKGNTDLANLPNYLDAIEACITERIQTAREQARFQRIMHKEQVLARLLNSQSRTGQNMLAKQLPEWADLVCSFPSFPITDSSGTEYKLSDAWKSIIQQSVLEQHHSILSLWRLDDIIELRDHLEDNLELGTPYATKVLATLRKTIGVLQEFGSLGLGSGSNGIINLDLLDNQNSPDSPAQDTPPKPAGTAQDRIRAILAARKKV